MKKKKKQATKRDIFVFVYCLCYRLSLGIKSETADFILKPELIILCLCSSYFMECFGKHCEEV